MKISTPNCDNCVFTEELGRDFNIRQKSQGLAASIKNFIHPSYKLVEAVRSLSMRIGFGEIVGFLGPNGAGKTTTLKMLSGLLFPSRGKLEVLGHSPFSREREFLSQISLVMGQKQNLWWDLPPIETFEIHRSIYNLDEKDFKGRIEELIDMLEISDCLETQTRKLSLGQRMRCELAVSLLHRPKVLFLDEPTIGLDILMQKKIRKFLLDYHARFKPTILLTSHYMDDVAALAKRVIVINNGLRIYDGLLSDLTEKMRPEKIITVILNSETFPKIEIPNVNIVSQESNLFRLKAPRENVGKLAAALYNTGLTIDLTIEDTPLEDIIGNLFTEKSNFQQFRTNV